MSSLIAMVGTMSSICQ